MEFRELIQAKHLEQSRVHSKCSINTSNWQWLLLLLLLLLLWTSRKRSDLSRARAASPTHLVVYRTLAHKMLIGIYAKRV